MRGASVEVRPLVTLDEMARACGLLDEVWELEPGETSEVRPSLLRALDHAGNYLAGAYAVPSGELVAASVGFFGEPLVRSLHSHITGVRSGRGRGIGAAIKWHQRAWALDRGARRVTWTYDPLIARNAFFNLTRLGARPGRYHVDFYGPMDDGPNRGQPTDRVDCVWDLESDAAARAAAAVVDPPGSGKAGDGPDVDAARAAGAVVVLTADPAGGPVVSGPIGAAERAMVGVPPDIETIRRKDPALALRWRLALRRVLAPMLTESSWQADGFARSGWYVLRRGGSG